MVATVAPVPVTARRAAEDQPTGGEPIEAEIAQFLRDHPVAQPDDAAADRALREARFDAGLAVVHFAEGCGGGVGWTRHCRASSSAGSRLQDAEIIWPAT
ncbi:hypothetical protein IWGMT90018_43950 [Mycobacterium kiyosense]|nr:hypothetical protein IWGMT90018_43950 [Mycobacterium kiyosense]